MKKWSYALGMILASGMLMAASAHAAVPSNLDQYGCRSEKAGEYKCYQGEQAGKTFKSQNDMLSKTSTRPMSSQVEPIPSGSPGNSPVAPGASAGGTAGNIGPSR